MKRVHAPHRMVFVILGFILLAGPLSLAQEEQPAEEEVAQKKFSLEPSKLSLAAYGQVSIPLDPYLETHDHAGPGFGLGGEYEVASWAKVGLGFRYSYHKGVDRTTGNNEHRIDWRTTGESVYGKFFPAYSEELPLFALAEISFYQFRPTHHVSYLSFPYGEAEEDGRTRTRIGFGVGAGLETGISEKITLNFQTLFTTFANKNLSFRFDSGYSTRISDESRLLILQAGILYSPF